MPASNHQSSSRSPAAVGMLLVAALALIVWVATTWASENARVEAVEEALSQVAVPNTWQETVNQFEPGRIVCMGANACPSARITWQTPAPLSVAEMTRVVTDAGWPLTVEGDCQPKTNTASLVGVCDARGDVDGLDIWLIQSRANGQPGAEVTLFVTPIP